MASRALIIVVEKYQDESLSTILGAHASGLRFAESIQSRDADSVVLLCAGYEVAERTHTNDIRGVLAAIQQLIRQGQNQTDDLFVFFNGHGMQDPATPERPADALLIAADYQGDELAGECCIRLSELQAMLSLFLGGRNHFYFIDACRVPADRTKLRPRSLGFQAQPAITGQPIHFTLFATNAGAAAQNDTRFADALIAGLSGVGRAKIWLRDNYYVTFDSLRQFVEARLKNERRIEAMASAMVSRFETGAKARGRIYKLPLDEISSTRCHVEVQGAVAGHALHLDALASQRSPEFRAFSAVPAELQFAPDDYKFVLKQQMLHEPLQFEQIEPDPLEPVDLFEDGRVVKFKALGLESASTTAPPLLHLKVPPRSTVLVTAMHDGSSQRVSEGLHALTLDPGEYSLSLLQHGTVLTQKQIRLAESADLIIDMFLDQISPRDQRWFPSLLEELRLRPQRDRFGLFNILEYVGPLADPDPSVWLALLGILEVARVAGPYLAPRDSPLSLLGPRLNFGSGLYFLVAGSRTPHVQWGSRDSMHPADLSHLDSNALGGFFFDPARSIDRQRLQIGWTQARPSRLAIDVFFGCVTLVIVILPEDKRDETVTIRQLVIPSVGHALRLGRERYYDPGYQWHVMRFVVQAQARYAKGLPLMPSEAGIDADIYAKFASIDLLDPIISVLLGHELIRNGQVQQNREFLSRLVMKLREAFPQYADVEALAHMAGLPYTAVAHPPMFRDGYLALRAAPEQGSLGGLEIPPTQQLDFHQMWTMMRQQND